MFKNFRKFETKLASNKLIIETGKMAQLTNGSCFVRYGETAVLVTATASQNPRCGIDFFPLSVDFEEKLYSVGKIPGSFSKREGKPSDNAVLSSRLIDRPIRPLFSNDIRHDVAVVCTVMSVDENCSAEIAAMIGASVALSISDIHWNGPICGVSVGLVDNKIIINPDSISRTKSDLDLVVASTSKKIIMIEACANKVPEDKIFEAIMIGHQTNCEIIKFIEKIRDVIGKPKSDFSSSVPSNKNLIYDEIESKAKTELENALDVPEKCERDQKINFICKKLTDDFIKIYPENLNEINEILYKLQKKIVRDWLWKGKRVDGRNFDEIRCISAEIGVLPRAHGSAMFTRGKTQVLTSVTLGPMSENQTIDDISQEENKRYMHHYNFHSFSVGETRPNRAPNRREIGHGTLAERALIPVLPSIDDFPYTIRLVSEVLSSNGSTSQGSVCSSTLALMDSGVPIVEAVAGISCGLVTKKSEWKTFVDIQGIEDFFGDMDFKVAGTRTGITAIQMDLKIDGLVPEIIKEALEKTRVARIKILDEVILKTIEKPKNELSKYAPKVFIIKIPVDKIRIVIGSGGKVVQKICSDFNVKIDIEDDGRIFVLASDSNNCKNAINFINSIVRDLKPGEIFSGKITKVKDFGAFIELMPGKEGLCHISKLYGNQFEAKSNSFKDGDVINVEITEIDPKGRINLKRVFTQNS
ncbi:MAG: polyribonucleotide nucleotidyltransferase [Oscillospiraceae bacterium]|nr:polyribonucleotide nucleotidyltransferase [Oscillospiraceae bacterium]